VLVTFAPDQHRSAFPRAWLEEHALGDGADGDGRTEDDKELWLPADLGPETGLPAMSWPSYLAGGKAEALEAVLRVGFVLLSGVPAVSGRVLEVAASFGYVRETNYGRLFDVRVEPAPGNLAFTSRAIRPHTDNPYREHPGAARPHRLQHEPALARAAPAGLLRGPGRPGQHPGRADT
jgi:gamma-butyrobetaine dioxygenase